MKIKTSFLMNAFLAILIAFSVTACVSSGPQFVSVAPVQKGVSDVYIYRPAGVMGGASSAILHNGKKIVNILGARNFIKYSITPGNHTFRTSTLLARSIPVTIKSVHPGEKHYIRIEYQFGVPYAFKMVEVSESQALTQLPDCFEVQ